MDDFGGTLYALDKHDKTTNSLGANIKRVPEERK